MLVFVFFPLQTLRERRNAKEQADGQMAEKTAEKTEEDENTPFNLCSSVDLDKVCACVCDKERETGDRRGVNRHQVIHPASFQNHPCSLNSHVVTLRSRTCENTQSHAGIFTGRKYQEL